MDGPVEGPSRGDVRAGMKGIPRWVAGPHVGGMSEPTGPARMTRKNADQATPHSPV